MRGVLVLLLLAAAALAGGDDRARLDAWDAYVLGESKDPRYAPVLLRQLRRYREREGGAAHAVRRAILDALIRSKAEVSARELLPLAKQYGVPVLALLVINAPAHPELLLERLGGKTSDSEWAAICNVLSSLRTPGFGAYLWSQLDPTLHITVIHGDGIGISGGSGCGFGGRACGRMTVPEGWPPRPLYHLSFKADTGATLLADGPQPVYLVRREYPPGQHGISRRTARVQRRGLLLAYVARSLCCLPDELGVDLDSSAWIAWRDAEHCEREMQATKARIEQSWSALKSRLVEASLLSADEARALPISLRIRVTDSRDDRRIALPHLPSGPAPVPQAR